MCRLWLRRLLGRRTLRPALATRAPIRQTCRDGRCPVLLAARRLAVEFTAKKHGRHPPEADRPSSFGERTRGQSNEWLIPLVQEAVGAESENGDQKSEIGGRGCRVFPHRI